MHKTIIAAFLVFGCVPAGPINDNPDSPQCSDGLDNDLDGLIDGADLGCESTQDNDEVDIPIVPPDDPFYQEIHVAGDFNNFDAADDAFALSYEGQGLWRGEFILPAGAHQLKLAADGDWLVNWGGGQDDIAPPEAGVGVQGGADISLELPLAGPYEVTLNEETGAWSLSFGASFSQGLSTVGQDFISLLSQLETATNSQALTLASTFVASHAQSELPIVKGGDVLFVALSSVSSSLSVAGSFNNFTTGQDTFVSLANGALGYVGRQIGFNERHAYKFNGGANWFKDPQNFEIEWDGFDPGTVGDFNSVFYTEGFTPVSRLRLLKSVHSQALNNNREVYVALPPGYDQSPNTSYPTLYFHDGNESIVRSQMDQIVRDQILSGQIAPIIAVFIALPSQDQRFDEYTFNTPGSRGDLYMSFVADELVPLIDAQFRTIESADARGVIGASLGGLISYHIGYERADVFHLIGGQSSSFFWDNNAMINRISSGPQKAGLRFYVDSGDPDGTCQGDNCDVTREMTQVLNNRGYPNLHVEQLGAVHDWFFWNERLPGALQFLFPAE